MARKSKAPLIKKNHSVYELAQKKWRSSGLSDEHARALWLRPLTREETRSQLRTDKAQPCGLLLPYFDLDGRPTKFFRIRYLEPPLGFAGVIDKPQRYTQPARTLNEVYIPPLLPTSWRAVAKDPTMPIYITEGELKSAAGCSVGLATIGLGGVDVWRSTKRGIVMLPQLEEIEWKNRQVVIVYDSDAATNLNVVRAQRQLAQHLIPRGALPAIASLPPAKNGGKQGLDDFLLAHGSKALIKMLESAPYFPEADALWALNEEVLYVRDPGVVVERRSGQRLEPGRFASHHYANRHYVETIAKNGVLVPKKRPLARRWLEWEARSEVNRITYAPGKPKAFDSTWNAWEGWGVEPVKGNIEPWFELLDQIFKGDVESRTWFERWCAYPIQFPGTKLYTACMLWGRHKGTGKTLVAYTLMGIYGRNAIEIKNKDLRGGFNSWAENRQFVYGDEIAGREARVDSEWLKGLITETNVRINAKFMPEYVVPDCMNYFFSANGPDSLFVEDGDRRYFVHEVTMRPLERSFYNRYDAWLGLRNGKYNGPGAAHLMDHLLHLPLGNFDAREHAPLTAAKRDMILHGKSDVGMWCVQLGEDPETTLRALGEKAAEECDLYTARQLRRCYDPEGRGKVTEPGMGRELARSGFRQVNAGATIRTKTCGIIRLYAVRNWKKWESASPQVINEHYERYFGEGAGKF